MTRFYIAWFLLGALTSAAVATDIYFWPHPVAVMLAIASGAAASIALAAFLFISLADSVEKKP